MSTIGSNDPREVMVTINGGNNNNTNVTCEKIWGETRYKFWNDKDNLNKNAASAHSGSDNSSEGFDFMQRKQLTDLELEMAELQQATNDNLAPVSFEGLFGYSDSMKETQYRDSPTTNTPQGKVLRCTSNPLFNREATFNRNSSLLRSTTKSRLLDTPSAEQRPERTPLSGQLKSGFVLKSDDDEIDPLLEEDIPEEYKRDKVDIWTLLQWVSLFLIISSLVCSLSIPYSRNKYLWKLKLWKWEVLVLVLVCGRLISGWIIRLIVFFIQKNFLLRKRVLYFVYGLRKAVQNGLWLGLVFIAWHFLFDKKVEKETKSKTLRLATRILVCLLFGTLLWPLKTLLIKVLASSFHVRTYFDRIQLSLFNQYVIETLSGPPLVEIQKSEEEDKRFAAEVQKLKSARARLQPGLSPRSGRVIGQKSPLGKNDKFSRTLSKEGDEGGITIDHLHKLNPKNVSAWNMMRLINIVRHRALSTLNDEIRDSTHHEHESVTHIRSENEAKAAARKIFENVANPESKFIYLEDLKRFMQDDEALKTLSLFEGASESKSISKSALKNWVVHAFRERRALALTLNDTKTAVNKLHHFVNVIVGIIIVIIWLLILGIATTKFLLFVSSQLVVVVFIFGNTCKTIFESIIFLFVMHPFDVGDWCEIEGNLMIVEEMNILTTVFLRDNNLKIMYPNSVLLTKSISNYYRSPDMGDAVEFCVHIATPAEKITVMKQKILSYIEDKKDHWHAAPMIIMKDVEDLNRVRIAVWLTHRMNHQDMGEKWVRRSLLVEEMVKIFRELDIPYRLLPIDINVHTMPPVKSSSLPPGWTATGS